MGFRTVGWTKTPNKFKILPCGVGSRDEKLSILLILSEFLDKKIVDRIIKNENNNKLQP